MVEKEWIGTDAIGAKSAVYFNENKKFAVFPNRVILLFLFICIYSNIICFRSLEYRTVWRKDRKGSILYNSLKQY